MPPEWRPVAWAQGPSSRWEEGPHLGPWAASLGQLWGWRGAVGLGTTLASACAAQEGGFEGP